MGWVNGVGMTRMNTPMAPVTTTMPTISATVARQLYGREEGEGGSCPFDPAGGPAFCGRSVSAMLLSSPLKGPGLSRRQ